MRNRVWQLWLFFLAFAWLLPGGGQPWPNAFSDLAVAVLFCVAGSIVFFRHDSHPTLSGVSIVAFCLALTPALQYVVGPLSFAGEAWVYSLYLFGLAMVIVLGSEWQSWAQDEPVDTLFFAIAVGAVFSVGIQVCQWLEFDLFGVWLLPSPPERPHANFGQPNNLGTFLIWGALAFAWGYHRRHVRGGLALFGTCFLMFGVALTQSRTAVLSAALVAGGLVLMRNRVTGAPALARGAVVVFLVLLVFRLSLPSLNEASGISHDIRRAGTADAASLRLAVYRLFFDAAVARPLGYGWNGVGDAFFEKVADGPGFFAFFSHTHNLLLDLLVSLGWVVGLPLGVLLCVWVTTTARALRSPGEMLPFLLVMVAGCHSMLEFPLHYGTLLLPAGMMAGVVEQRMGRCRVPVKAAWVRMGVLFCSALLAGIGRDVMVAQEAYRNLRLERAQIVGSSLQSGGENFILLDQIATYFEFATKDVTVRVTDERISAYQRSLLTVSSPYDYLKLIQMLAIMGRVEEAQKWVERMRKSLSPLHFAAMASTWVRWRESNPSMPDLVW